MPPEIDKESMQRTQVTLNEVDHSIVERYRTILSIPVIHEAIQASLKEFGVLSDADSWVLLEEKIDGKGNRDINDIAKAVLSYVRGIGWGSYRF